MRFLPRQFSALRPWGGVLHLLIWGCFGGTCAWGQACFTQDFSSSTTASDYVGSDANHFDGMTTDSKANFSWSIASNALVATKSLGYGGALTRSTDLPTVSGAIYQFSLNVVTATSTQSLPGIYFQVGAGFDTSTSAADSPNVHSQFAINLNTDGTYVFRNVNANTNGSKSFTGTQNIFFVVNNTGGTLTYTAPDGTSQTVQNDKWDLWVGKSQQFDEAAATTASVAPTDFKLTWGATGGDGRIQLDNFSVIPVPEPTPMLGGLLLITAAGWVRCRWLRRRVVQFSSRSRVLFAGAADRLSTTFVLGE